MKETYDDLRAILVPLITQELSDLDEAVLPFKPHLILQLAETNFMVALQELGGTSHATTVILQHLFFSIVSCRPLPSSNCSSRPTYEGRATDAQIW